MGRLGVLFLEEPRYFPFSQDFSTNCIANGTNCDAEFRCFRTAYDLLWWAGKSQLPNPWPVRHECKNPRWVQECWCQRRYLHQIKSDNFHLKQKLRRWICSPFGWSRGAPAYNLLNRFIFTQMKNYQFRIKNQLGLHSIVLFVIFSRFWVCFLTIHFLQWNCVCWKCQTQAPHGPLNPNVDNPNFWLIPSEGKNHTLSLMWSTACLIRSRKSLDWK